ncbi:MAG: hypothetical protein ACP5PX_06695 [Candidatus Hadarchaeum sp.]|uniref:hypothetical protein n=1 Tax=Candidatus Hadarchaeum sp. TaxID=2883567 RepID=UPI003D113893
MRDGALKWALRLLGIALVVVPIILAFSANGWDLKKALLPSEQELSQVSEGVGDIFGGGFSEETMSMGQPVISGSSVRVPVTFKSPFKVPIKLKEVNLTVSGQGMPPIQLQMEEEELEIPANGSVNFTLVGTIPGSPPSNPQITAVNVTFEIYGVTIQFSPKISGG